MGIVTFDGNVGGEIRFTLGFRTRIGGVGGFFFMTSRETKPILTGQRAGVIAPLISGVIMAGNIRG